MFEFFDKCWGFIEMIITLIINSVNSLIMLIGVVLNIPLTIAHLSVLPAVIFTGVTITISFSIVKFIVNR